jgi:hypothetical protein
MVHKLASGFGREEMFFYTPVAREEPRRGALFLLLPAPNPARRYAAGDLKR